MTCEPATLTDEELVAATAETLAVPRTETNSFTLHAPLELLARAELLPLVDEARRRDARRRFASLAAIHEASGREVPPPAPLGATDAAGALAALAEALATADPDLADAAVAWLAARHTAPEIASALAGPLVLEMGAAGHAPILFASYLRLPGSDPRPLRGVARQLAEYPDLRVRPEWLEPPGGPAGAPTRLEAGLAALEVGDEPGWGIFALVDNARRGAVMATLPRLGDADLDEGFRVLFRVAARSMIEDDPAHAPYGWSHALTIPLGIRQTLHLHDRRREAFDVATMLTGAFRFGHGAAPLSGPTVAPPGAPDGRELASRAAVQHDAHLVKYVLACRHAARLDPAFATLYGRAAEHLVEWWDANPPADDPLT